MNQLDISSNHQNEIHNQCEQLMVRRLQDNQPALFHLASGGGRTRLKLCIASGVLLDLHTQDITAVASCIELLHNASLIHDDLQDNDEMRRGAKAAWKVFGKNAAICAGDLMINEAYHCLSTAKSQHSLGQLIQLTAHAISQTIHGQTKDLEASITIDAKEYENIAVSKSGPLFVLSLVLPLVLSNNNTYIKQAEQALYRFAVAYQIIDDIDDWELDKTNGQLNIVNILALRTNIDVALYTAVSRAEYLLHKCINELDELPNQCAAPHKQMAMKLLNAVKQLDIPKVD